MVRPGLNRLRTALNVKVQPNKSGTSSMQGHFIKTKKSVNFNSSGNTPYNNLANSKSFTPTYTDVQKLIDQNKQCVKKKEWSTVNGNILSKSWNSS